MAASESHQTKDKKLRLIFYSTHMVVWQADDLSMVSIPKDGFYSLTKTQDEISIVCEKRHLPNDIKGKINTGWVMFKVEGQLDFSLTGIMASIATPLAENGISLYALSTYDTDYVLIKKDMYEKAMTVLSETFEIIEEEQ